MLEQLEEYLVPKTVAEAVKLLQRDPPGSAVAFEGDVDFHWWRLQRAKRLVDTTRLGLSYIREEKGGLVLGANTVLEDIVTSKECQHFANGLLPLGALGLVSPLKRHSTTLAAMLINVVPVVDIVPALLVLDAKVTVQSRKKRTIPLSELFSKRGLTVLENELIVEITVPKPIAGLGTAIERQALTPSDKPIMIAAAAVNLSRGKIARARVAISGGVHVPARFTKAEEELTGKAPDLGVFACVAAGVQSAVEPIDDVRASADHRRAVTAPLVRRALARAAGIQENAA